MNYVVANVVSYVVSYVDASETRVIAYWSKGVITEKGKPFLAGCPERVFSPGPLWITGYLP